ncbi:CD225/dispanin family protein [Lysobacter sp. 2RAB21]
MIAARAACRRRGALLGCPRADAVGVRPSPWEGHHESARHRRRLAYPNYLPWSITLTVLGACFCCLIGAAPGIVALVFGNQVNSKYAAGDEDGARRASETTKIWCWVGTGLVALGLIWTILSFFINGMSMMSDEFLQELQKAQSR